MEVGRALVRWQKTGGHMLQKFRNFKWVINVFDKYKCAELKETSCIIHVILLQCPIELSNKNWSKKKTF